MSLKKIGALWKKEDKNGNEYFSGNLDLGVLGNVSLAIFPNKNKEGEKQPDFTINLMDNEK
ncbi:MAG: hypothetical protein CSYNP_03097 [Syntrophus sp. SKADARSKE-3]|nr:hypothetical protein [Syntrophus sp. SKADARSKE-3]